MPLVPIFNSEPFTSVLGVMRFPNELEKAETYAAWSLARGPLRRLSEQGVDVDPNFVLKIGERASQIATLADEVKKAEVAGTAVGAITTAMVRRILRHPKQATWERAIRDVRNNDDGLPSGRPLLMDYRRQMNKVAHFWGAYYDRGGRYGSCEEFFTRAEGIRRLIFNFELEHANATGGKSGWTIQADDLNAFHVGVTLGVPFAINASPIPSPLWREPIAKRAQRKPSEKIRTP